MFTLKGETLREKIWFVGTEGFRALWTLNPWSRNSASQPLNPCSLNFLHFEIMKFFAMDLLISFSENLVHCPGFYPSTSVYSQFLPKIQFHYCLLSSLSPWWTSKEKCLKFRSPDCWKMHSDTLSDSKNIGSLYIVDKHDFFPWILLENTFIPVMFVYIFFVCGGSYFCCNFRVLWGVSKESWQEW